MGEKKGAGHCSVTIAKLFQFEDENYSRLQGGSFRPSLTKTKCFPSTKKARANITRVKVACILYLVSYAPMSIIPP
jgi:hypothetical protein